MYDAAIKVTAFFETFNHDDVVLMGVDADVRCDGFAVIQNSVKDTMRVGGAGDAMDDIVRFSIEPLAIVDDLIGDIGTRNEGKSTDNRTSGVCHYVAMALFDIINKFLLGRVAVGPLAHIAIAAHDLACLVTEAEDDGQVARGGMSEGVFHLDVKTNKVNFFYWPIKNNPLFLCFKQLSEDEHL